MKYTPFADLVVTTREICGIFDPKEINITLKLKKCLINTMTEASISTKIV